MEGNLTTGGYLIMNGRLLDLSCKKRSTCHIRRSKTHYHTSETFRVLRLWVTVCIVMVINLSGWMSVTKTHLYCYRTLFEGGGGTNLQVTKLPSYRLIPFVRMVLHKRTVWYGVSECRDKPCARSKLSDELRSFCWITSIPLKLSR